MKKILIFFMLFSLGLTVSAQRQKRSFDPKTRAKAQSEKLKTQLKLNDKQEKDVFNAYFDFYKKQQEIFKNKGDREKMMKEMQKLRTDLDKKLQKILTKEQYKIYQNILKERKKKMKERMGKHGGGKRR